MTFSLPDSIPISSEILRLISEIERFRGGWEVGHSIAPERLAQLRRVATIESVGSSTRIEGAKLDNTQVASLLGKLGTESFATRDEQEVAGYATVLEQIFAHADSIPLSANFIKQLHRDLLQFSRKDDRHRGEWKTHPNLVAAFDADGQQIGIIFQTSSPLDTPLHMEALLDWHRPAEKDTGLHPLLRVGIFVIIASLFASKSAGRKRYRVDTWENYGNSQGASMAFLIKCMALCLPSMRKSGQLIVPAFR